MLRFMAQAHRRVAPFKGRGTPRPASEAAPFSGWLGQSGKGYIMRPTGPHEPRATRPTGSHGPMAPVRPERAEEGSYAS